MREFVALLLGLGLTACGVGDPADCSVPGEAARRMLLVATRSATVSTAAFGLSPSDERAPGLADALDRLPELREVRVVGVTALEADRSFAVDLEALLPAGGSAAYSIHLRRGADDRWQAELLLGPGVAWPSAPRSPGTGLTVSEPPPL